MNPFANRLLLALTLLPALIHAERQPVPADQLLQRGVSLAAANKLDEAESALIEANREYPADARFRLELAGLMYRRHNQGAAKRYLHQALRLDPSDTYGNYFLGTLYWLDRNLPAALKYWNRIDKPILQTVRFSPVPPLDETLRDRAFAISGGQMFTLERLRRMERNIKRLRIFSDYGFDLTPRPDDRFDLTIRTVPIGQALRGTLGRILPMLRGIPYQQVNLDFYNVGQQAVNFTSLWRWDENKRRGFVELTSPASLGSYRIALDAREERWDLRRVYHVPGGWGDVRLIRFQAGAELTVPLTDKLQWTPGLWAVGRQVRNGDRSAAFAGGWSADIRNRFDYRLWSWPERRLRIDSSATLRTGRLWTGPSSRLVSAEAGSIATWIPQANGEKYVVRADLRAGAISRGVPFDEMFLLGMERDNDLWMRGHVGTRDGRKGNAPMGTRYALARTEVDREIWKVMFLDLKAGPFFDTGRIGDPAGTFGSRGWMYDAGIQVKLRTAGGVQFSAVYGRDLRGGGGVFYTAVTR